VNELLQACAEASSTEVDSEDVRQALIKGKYDIYPTGQNDFVQNVFSIGTELESSPLLAVRVLTYLEERSAEEADQVRYTDVSSVVEYITAMSVDAQDAFSCIEWLVSVGVILNYDPTAKKVKDAHRVRISASGTLHLRWAQNDWIYLEAMAEVAPLFDADVCAAIRADTETHEPHRRRRAIDRFVGYLLQEDIRICLVPTHARYMPQMQIRNAYQRQLDILRNPSGVVTSRRFGRRFGRIIKWLREKGYGFIRPSAGGANVFVHVTEVLESNGEYPPEGTEVEYGLANDGKAHEVVPLNWKP
jgi:cold shock CspA family protein